MIVKLKWSNQWSIVKMCDMVFILNGLISIAQFSFASYLKLWALQSQVLQLDKWFMKAYLNVYLLSNSSWDCRSVTRPAWAVMRRLFQSDYNQNHYILEATGGDCRAVETIESFFLAAIVTHCVFSVSEFHSWSCLEQQRSDLGIHINVTNQI